jgi:hypothetical protein
MEKKEETVQELYNRVKAKRWKMFLHIAMEIKIADEAIKKVGVREGNIIGQQTAAATTVIRAHKLLDSDREAKSAKDRAEKLQSESINNEQSTKIA